MAKQPRKPDYDHEPKGLRQAPPEQKQMMPEPEKERIAADRELEQRSYPTNNFALTGLVLGVLIVVIGILYALGLVN